MTTVAGYFNASNPRDNLGFVDGPLAQAKFHYIHAVAFAPLTHAEQMAKAEQARAASARGGTAALAVSSGSTELYICDDNNYRIRKVDLAAGTVETLAGDGREGCSDGPGSTATNGAVGLCVGQGGNVYVADYLNHRIRLIQRAGPRTPA